MELLKLPISIDKSRSLFNKDEVVDFNETQLTEPWGRLLLPSLSYIQGLQTNSYYNSFKLCVPQQYWVNYEKDKNNVV